MSEQTQEQPKKRGPKPKDAQASAPRMPRVSVIDRRLKKPFGSGTVPITLKTPGQWECRWVYSKLRPGHLYSMTHLKGWIFVEPAELDGSPDEYGLTAKDNRLVRGDHGEEVLMKMPLADFRKIAQAKTEFNLGQLGKQKMREAVAQATAKNHGDQAGDTVFDAFAHGDIKDARGVDPELEAESA